MNEASGMDGRPHDAPDDGRVEAVDPHLSAGLRAWSDGAAPIRLEEVIERADDERRSPRAGGSPMVQRAAAIAVSFLALGAIAALAARTSDDPPTRFATGGSGPSGSAGISSPSGTTPETAPERPGVTRPRSGGGDPDPTGPTGGTSIPGVTVAIPDPGIILRATGPRPSVASDPGVGPRTDAGPTEITVARTGPDERTLVVSFWADECDYAPEIDETSERVTVRIVGADADGCRQPLIARTLTVELRDPLGARRLFDGTGNEVRVIDGGTLVRVPDMLGRPRADDELLGVSADPDVVDWTQTWFLNSFDGDVPGSESVRVRLTIHQLIGVNDTNLLPESACAVVSSSIVAMPSSDNAEALVRECADGTRVITWFQGGGVVALQARFDPMLATRPPSTDLPVPMGNLIAIAQSVTVG